MDDTQTNTQDPNMPSAGPEGGDTSLPETPPMSDMPPQSQDGMAPSSQAPQEGGDLKRPWQGTVLGILGILGLVVIGLLILMMLFGGAVLSSVLSGAAGDAEISGLMGVVAGLSGFMALIFALPFLLQFFVTRGVFKGQKWAIVVTVIFAGLSALAKIPGLLEGEAVFNMTLNVLVLVFGIQMWKHPFYNRA